MINCMTKTEMTRTKAIALFNSMHQYINTVGKNADKLAWQCDNIITYEPNEEFIQEHNKLLSKLKLNLDRALKKVLNNNAKTYEEGDKKGTFILNEKNEFLFTAEAQNIVDEESNKLNDFCLELIDAMMRETVSIYIEQASLIPEALSPEFRNSLELLIPTLLTDTTQ